jgi:hypothetical protein
LDIPALNTDVRIKWLDTTSLKGWHWLHPGDTVDSSPRLQVSLGVLVGASPQALTLAHTISPRGELDSTLGLMDLLILPLGCVTEVQVLP